MVELSWVRRTLAALKLSTKDLLPAQSFNSILGKPLGDSTSAVLFNEHATVVEDGCFVPETKRTRVICPISLLEE